MTNRTNSLYMISKIDDHLYLSGYGVVTTWALKQRSITAVIDATNVPEMDARDGKWPGIEYLKVAVDDCELAPLNRYFDVAADFIQEQQRNGGRTLVHCAAGISRSATLCIVYLVRYHGKTLQDAYLTVLKARPIISPNSGFWRQMIEFEKRITGRSTVKMLVTSCRRELPDVYFDRVKLKGKVRK